MTPKQEQFSQLVANGMSQSTAYKEAYNANNMNNDAIHVEAHKLANHPKVSLRIKEIQSEIREKVQVSKESLTKELEEDRLLAREQGQASAAISAVMGKAKLHGLLIDKQETRHIDPVDVVVTYIRPDDDSAEIT